MHLPLLIKPSSRTDKIIIDAEGNFKIHIKAPPVDGKANDYLIKFLSKKLNLPKSSIEIASGANNQLKKLIIDAPEDFVLQRLRELAEDKKK